MWYLAYREPSQSVLISHHEQLQVKHWNQKCLQKPWTPKYGQWAVYHGTWHISMAACSCLDSSPVACSPASSCWALPMVLGGALLHDSVQLFCSSEAAVFCFSRQLPLPHSSFLNHSSGQLVANSNKGWPGQGQDQESYIFDWHFQGTSIKGKGKSLLILVQRCSC